MGSRIHPPVPHSQPPGFDPGAISSMLSRFGLWVTTPFLVVWHPARPTVAGVGINALQSVVAILTPTALLPPLQELPSSVQPPTNTFDALYIPHTTSQRPSCEGHGAYPLNSF